MCEAMKNEEQGMKNEALAHVAFFIPHSPFFILHSSFHTLPSQTCLLGVSVSLWLKKRKYVADFAAEFGFSD
jgi:hypothetical protein